MFPYIIKKKCKENVWWIQIFVRELVLSLAYKVYVDFGSTPHSEVLSVRVVDTKTMLIQTPLCPVPWSSMAKLPVSLRVEQDNVVLPPMPFCDVPRNEPLASVHQTRRVNFVF